MLTEVKTYVDESEARTYVPVNKYDVISAKDIDFVMDNTRSVWENFNDLWREENAIGDGKFVRATQFAFTFLFKHLSQMDISGGRALSDDRRDLYQEAWIKIRKNIANYNPDKGAQFPTYMEKWFLEVVRETRNDSMSDYNVKSGYRVYSSDVQTRTEDGEEISLEFMDTDSSVESVYEKKQKMRSEALLHGMIGEDMDAIPEIPVKKKNETAEEKQTREMAEEEWKRKRENCYVNAAFYSKFLGGFQNLPSAMQDEMEHSLGIC